MSKNVAKYCIHADDDFVIKNPTKKNLQQPDIVLNTFVCWFVVGKKNLDDYFKIVLRAQHNKLCL